MNTCRGSARWDEKLAAEKQARELARAAKDGTKERRDVSLPAQPATNQKGILQKQMEKAAQADAKGGFRVNLYDDERDGREK